MSKIDPVTLEIMTEGLISVVREMRATVFRTARSVAIYEALVTFLVVYSMLQARWWLSRRISKPCGTLTLVR